MQLSHFRNIQETHTILSDSISFHPKDNSSMESSSTKGLNLPSKPSPLHNTESLTHPETSIIHRNSYQDTFNRQEEYFSQSRQLSAHEIVTQSPLKNRQAPPPPPPPSAPTSRISTSQEDDDSLVFKMSELSGGLYEQKEEEDFLKRLKDSTAMRRINSSGNIPSSTKMMEVQTGHYSDDGISTVRHKLTNRLFYNDL